MPYGQQINVTHLYCQLTFSVRHVKCRSEKEEKTGVFFIRILLCLTLIISLTMNSFLHCKLKRLCHLFIAAILALGPIHIMAQGRTVTRANQFEQGGLKGGDYLKIEELVIFEGTWRWVSAAGDSVFTIQLWREKFVPPAETKNTMGFFFDAIAGHYNLLVNGYTVSTNENMRDELGYPTFFGSDFQSDGIESLDITFRDFPKNKTAIGTIELFPGNPNLARWSMRNMETIVVPTGTAFHRGFSLPNNIVLNRVQATPPPLP